MICVVGALCEQQPGRKAYLALSEAGAEWHGSRQLAILERMGLATHVADANGLAARIGVPSEVRLYP